MYAQHVVPGWIVKVQFNGETYEFHTDAMGDQFVTCDPGLVGTPLPTINIAQAAGLHSVTALVIAPASTSTSSSSSMRVDDPAKVSALVQALNGPTSLQPPVNCKTLYSITFEMPDRTVSFDYACQGDGSLVRGGQAFFRGEDGIVPGTFSRQIGRIFASRPFPGMPPA